MAHYCRPPGVPNRPGLGYDVDGKLASDSIWRMQIPVGSSRNVALWGGKDLWVRSNNPLVVPPLPSDGRIAGMFGDLKILTLEGKMVGTSLLDAGLGNSVWVTLQVQVTLSDGSMPSEYNLPGIGLIIVPQAAAKEFTQALRA